MKNFIKENGDWFIMLLVSLSIFTATFFIPKPKKEIVILASDMYLAAGACANRKTLSFIEINVDTEQKIAYCGNGDNFNVTDLPSKSSEEDCECP